MIDILEIGLSRKLCCTLDSLGRSSHGAVIGRGGECLAVIVFSLQVGLVVRKYDRRLLLLVLLPIHAKYLINHGVVGASELSSYLPASLVRRISHWLLNLQGLAALRVEGSEVEGLLDTEGGRRLVLVVLVHSPFFPVLLHF